MFSRIFSAEMIYFFSSLELKKFWKEKTRNQFTAQTQRDKLASNIHNNSAYNAS